MAWNGSNGASAPAAPAKKPVAPWHGVVALVAIVLFGSAAYFLISQSATKPNEEDSQMLPELIDAVDPSLQQKTDTPATQAVEVVVKEAPKADDDGRVYDEKGVWYDDRGRPHYKPARTIQMGSRTIIGGQPWVPPRQIFSHPSEVELDRVLSAQPGDRILGETNWRLFEKDLQEALISPIHFEPEDTPEEIQRKKDVIEAKKELAGMIGDGLNPCDVLRQAQDDLNNLANLYDDLNRTLYEARNSGDMTEDEISDYVRAANQMLESKGVFAKKFYTPEEIREKAAAAKQRRLEKQLGY